MNDYAVGIDLGGTNLKAALVKQGEGLVEIRRCPTEAEKGPDHVVGRIGDLVEAMMAEAPDEDVAGVGIGSPGVINWARTTVSHPPNLPGWEVVNLQEALKARIGDRPVIVENDANVAGLGSAFYGAGRPYDSFIMVTLGTGVGGAIIYQNRIFRGATGAAGEMGHMTVDYEGAFANSGVAGAVEAYLGQQFLSAHARNHLVNYPDSRVYELTDGDLTRLTPRILYDAAREGDPGATSILAWAGHKLGVVMGSAVNLLDIRTILVGGGVSAAGDYILEPARQALPHYVVPGMRDGVQLLREELGNEVSLLGAAHLAFVGDDAHVGE